MGHVRMGRLPKTQRWAAVLRLLTGARPQADAVSDATLFAAERQLRELASREEFSFPFWLLVRLTWASRSDNFVGALNELGLDATPATSGLAFVSMVADRVRDELARAGESDAFTALASLALNRTLNAEFRSGQFGLFQSTTADLQGQLRQLSKQSQFERLAQRYFGDFLGRTLTYFLDREAANSLATGPGGLASVSDTQELLAAVERHAHQSAVIMRKFAGDWYSKHQWESRGEISREETHGFVAQALRKLRSELRFEAGR
jgi:hypothetical protein